MGQISMEIYAPTGSLLSGNLQAIASENPSAETAVFVSLAERRLFPDRPDFLPFGKRPICCRSAALSLNDYPSAEFAVRPVHCFISQF